MKRRRLFVAAFSALIAAVFAGASTTAVVRRNTGPTDLADVTFDVGLLTEEIWYGAANGSATDKVEIETTGPPPASMQGVWAGPARFKVLTGNSSFVALADGKINTYNGTFHMRGRVSQGANAGAFVLISGQIASINPSRLTGTIRVISPQ